MWGICPWLATVAVSRIAILCWSQVNLSLLKKSVQTCEQQVAETTLQPIIVTAFLMETEVWSSFSWIQSHVFSAFKALQVLFSIYFRVLSFWLIFCSVCKYSFCTSVWFGDQTILTQAGWKCLQFIPLEIWAASLKLCWFFSLDPIPLDEAVFWKLDKKAFVLTSLGQAVPLN